MNGEAEPLPLPDHLRGRLVSYWPSISQLNIVDPTKQPAMPAGTLGDWWPVLTPEQRHGVLVASITVFTEVGRYRINKWVDLHLTGEITVEPITKAQAALAAGGKQ